MYHFLLFISLFYLRASLSEKNINFSKTCDHKTIKIFSLKIIIFVAHTFLYRGRLSNIQFDIHFDIEEVYVHMYTGV